MIKQKFVAAVSQSVTVNRLDSSLADRRHKTRTGIPVVLLGLWRMSPAPDCAVLAWSNDQCLPPRNDKHKHQQTRGHDDSCGPKEPCMMYRLLDGGCTWVPTRKYDWTIRERQRCDFVKLFWPHYYYFIATPVARPWSLVSQYVYMYCAR